MNPNPNFNPNANANPNPSPNPNPNPIPNPNPTQARRDRVEMHAACVAALRRWEPPQPGQLPQLTEAGGQEEEAGGHQEKAAAQHPEEEGEQQKPPAVAHDPRAMLLARWAQPDSNGTPAFHLSQTRTGPPPSAVTPDHSPPADLANLASEVNLVRTPLAAGPSTL